MTIYPKTLKLLRELFDYVKEHNEHPQGWQIGEVEYNLIPEEEQEAYLAEIEYDRAIAHWDSNIVDARIGLQIQRGASGCNEKVWHIVLHIDTPNTKSVFLRKKELPIAKVFHGDRCNSPEYYLKAMPVLESRQTFIINE